MTMGRLLIALAIVARDPVGLISAQLESMWMSFLSSLFLMLRLVSLSEEPDLLENTI